MNNQEQLLTLKETLERLERQRNTYQEQESCLKEKLEKIRNEKRSLSLLYYKMQEIYSNLEIKTILEEENLELYRYELSTGYCGQDLIDYVLIKKGINPEEEYFLQLNELAREHLESYGYMSEDDYYSTADELEIDLDDEEAIENSDLADIVYTTYEWRIERVTDYSELNINLKDIERWD